MAPKSDPKDGRAGSGPGRGDHGGSAAGSKGPGSKPASGKPPKPSGGKGGGKK